MMTGLLSRGGCGVMMPGAGLCAPESSPEVTSSSSPLSALGQLGALGSLGVVASTSHGLAGQGHHHHYHHHGLGAGMGGNPLGSGGVISPSHSLESSDIGDVDLELFDMDLHGNPQHRQNLIMQHRLQGLQGLQGLPGLPQGHSSFVGTSHCSDTSESISGKRIDATTPSGRLECPLKSQPRLGPSGRRRGANLPFTVGTALTVLTYLTRTATYCGAVRAAPGLSGLIAALRPGKASTLGRGAERLGLVLVDLRREAIFGNSILVKKESIFENGRYESIFESTPPPRGSVGG